MIVYVFYVFISKGNVTFHSILFLLSAINCTVYHQDLFCFSLTLNAFLKCNKLYKINILFFSLTYDFESNSNYQKKKKIFELLTFFTLQLQSQLRIASLIFALSFDFTVADVVLLHRALRKTRLGNWRHIGKVGKQHQLNRNKNQTLKLLEKRFEWSPRHGAWVRCTLRSTLFCRP